MIILPDFWQNDKTRAYRGFAEYSDYSLREGARMNGKQENGSGVKCCEVLLSSAEKEKRHPLRMPL